MIEIKNLQVRRKHCFILNDINLLINRGDRVLIRGKSGSGKSTLLKVILLFEPFSGILKYEKEAIDEKNLHFYRKNLAYISQTVPNFNERTEEFLKLPFGYKANRHLHFNKEKTMDLFHQLNIDSSVLNISFSCLSGGEKQRLMVLQTLLMDKPILILDEVTSNLDRENIECLISEITSDAYKTVISVSHNQEWEGHCNRILELRDGKIYSQRYT